MNLILSILFYLIFLVHGFLLLFSLCVCVCVCVCVRVCVCKSIDHLFLVLSTRADNQLTVQN